MSAGRELTNLLAAFDEIIHAGMMLVANLSKRVSLQSLERHITVRFSADLAVALRQYTATHPVFLMFA